MKKKRCKSCHVKKDIGEFSISLRTKKLCVCCNKCREVGKKYDLEHKEQRKQYLKRYKQENKEDLQKRSKKYKQENQQKIKQQNKVYRDTHKEQIKKYAESHKEERNKYIKQYEKENKERIRQKSKKYRLENEEKLKEKRKEYYQNNKDKIKQQRRNWKCLHNKQPDRCPLCNPLGHLKSLVRSRIRMALRTCSLKKDKHSIQYLGCSINFYKSYIEAQFTNGMNWKNIQLDHVVPLSSATNKEELEKLFKWENTQPLLIEDNLIKHDRMPTISEMFNHIQLVTNYCRYSTITYDEIQQIEMKANQQFYQWISQYNSI